MISYIYFALNSILFLYCHIFFSRRSYLEILWLCTVKKNANYVKYGKLYRLSHWQQSSVENTIHLLFKVPITWYFHNCHNLKIIVFNGIKSIVWNKYEHFTKFKHFQYLAKFLNPLLLVKFQWEMEHDAIAVKKESDNNINI